MENDLKSKGYNDLRKLSWDYVKKYGYSEEQMPPGKVGSEFWTFVGYLFLGSLIPIFIFIASINQEKSKIADLKRERSRLKKIEAELGKLQL